MSQRILIVGVSESGKTTLANKLISESQIPVFIRDPVGADWSRCTARFNTSDELKELIIMQKGEPFICVIDEAAEFFNASLAMNHWVFSRGRHHAMLPIAIAQRIQRRSSSSITSAPRSPAGRPSR